MAKKIFICIVIWIMPAPISIYGEEGVFSDIPILNSYIQGGLVNNLALKQKEFSYQKSIKALDEARGMFFPSVNLDARYSKADGGRLIEFPVGDLLNPAYQSINEIFIALDQPPRPFPVLENEYIRFLRETEHDTKVRVVQPVFNSSIWYNYKIKSDLKDISQIDVSIYKRELIYEIKKVYYNILRLDHLYGLAEETETLIKENLRISQKLFENQKITKDVVYRAKSDLSGVAQYLAEIGNSRRTAASYFNFLLNRSLDEPIVMADDGQLNFTMNYELEAQKQIALQNRDELIKIRKAIELTGNTKKMAGGEFLPAISLAGDFGYQGEQYNFDEAHDYWMVSGIMQWNLFRGFQDKAKYQQAEISKKQLQTRYEELKNQIQLQVQDAALKINAAQLSMAAAREQVISARESFRLMEKKFDEGMAAQVQYLDARNNWTKAQVNLISAGYQLLIYQAELEKATASIRLGEKRKIK